jgi:hypothetical protein
VNRLCYVLLICSFGFSKKGMGCALWCIARFSSLLRDWMCAVITHTHTTCVRTPKMCCCCARFSFSFFF